MCACVSACACVCACACVSVLVCMCVHQQDLCAYGKEGLICYIYVLVVQKL